MPAFISPYFFKIVIIFLLVAIPPFLIASLVNMNMFLTQSIALIQTKNDNELARTGALLEQTMKQMVEVAQSGVTNELYTKTDSIIDQLNVLKNLSKTVFDHQYLHSVYHYNADEHHLYVSNYGILREIGGTSYQWIEDEVRNMTIYQVKATRIRVMQDKDQPIHIISIVAKLPVKSGKQLYLIYNLNIDKIYNHYLFQLNENPEIYNYYLADGSGRIIIHRDAALINAAPAAENAQNQQLAVSSYTLDTVGWRLISEVNVYNLFRDIHALRARMIVLLVMTTVMIVFAVILGTKQLYKPIRKVIAQTVALAGKTTGSMSGKLGEFEMISSAFELIVVTNRKLNSQLHEYEDLLKKTLLLQLMKERNKDTIDIERYLYDYRAHLAVALFTVKSGSYQETDSMEMVGMLERTLQPKFHADVFADSGDRWIALCRLNDPDIRPLIDDLTLCMEERFLENVIVSIGGVHPLEHIHNSYTEAMYAFHMGRIYSPSTNVYYYNELPTYYQSQNIQNYDIERLELSVRQHDEEVYSMLLDRMFRHDISMTEYNYNLYMNISLLIRLYDQDSVKFLHEFNELLTDKGIMNAATVKHFFFTKFKDFNADYISDVKEYIKKIDRYVALNYKSNFSLDDVAEHVGITKQYVCVLFKQHYNTTLVDYVSQYRVEQAKQLLAGTAMKISEIGGSVGFNSNSYFTKVFRQYCGIAPSEYRELSKNRLAGTTAPREAT